MNFESVLIVTYGRSGSTLLQGLLNSIPRLLIRGENYNMCHGLLQSYKSLVQSKTEFGGDFARKVEHPWYGAPMFNPERFIADARALVMHQLRQGPEALGIECIGFKEIRYTAGNLPAGGDDDYAKNFKEYLDFLAELFPRLGIVFLTRPHDQVAGSFWWKQYSASQVDKLLTNFERCALSWQNPKASTFHIDYTDMVSQSPRVAGLFEFIGADYSAEKVAEVLSREHSAENRPETLQKIRNYSINISADKQIVSTLFLDELPLKLSGGDAFRISGVCRLADQPLTDQLVLRDASGSTFPVKGGLASPHYAKRFPDQPDANTARFRTDELSFARSPSWELCVKSSQQLSVLVRVESAVGKAA